MLKYIEEGKKIALVSDAGKPMIWDPGNVLISELRKRNIEITSLADKYSDMLYSVFPIFIVFSWNFNG